MKFVNHVAIEEGNLAIIAAEAVKTNALLVAILAELRHQKGTAE